jgi:flagellar biosynthetic protein FliO
MKESKPWDRESIMEGLLELNLVSTGIKTFAMLFVVLALLVAVLYFLKRFSIQAKETQGGVSIKALSSLSLSTKDRIQVVEIAGEKYVLGISPSGITLITKIIESSDIDNANTQTKYEIDE